jgi:hypothetical protein
MANLVFTPGQREEAMNWVKSNCEAFEGFPILQDYVVDMYFKMKSITFPLKSTEFVMGIEYKDSQKVADGNEKIKITFQNPHKKGEYDVFAHQVAIELLNSLKP